MSRLRQHLAQLSAQSDPRRRAEKESHNLAGDGLEMAARAALEAWQQRPRHPDESDVFRLGYRLACHELALVFRAMRKGEPPSKEEFAELRRLVFEDAAGEDAGPSMSEKIAQLNDTIGWTPPAQFAREHPEAVIDDGSGEDEPQWFCSMHGGPLAGDCISCREMAGEPEDDETEQH